MDDPFLIAGPAVINVSGGRTSALMLRRVLDAHGGRLPSGVHAVFCNTGKERPETLRFVADMQERWGVAIRWLERRGDSDAGFAEVEYETASRDGEPFEELINERHYLPNSQERFCTVELKILVTRAFMLACGFAHWTSVIGFRRDEASRVAKLRGDAQTALCVGEQLPLFDPPTPKARKSKPRRPDEWDLAFPLHAAGIYKAHVEEHWRASRGGMDLDAWLNLEPAARPGWDLALRSYEGNCDLCYLKGRAKRLRIMREHPEFVGWWAAAEARVGARFHAHEPGYAATLDGVRRLQVLPIDLDTDTGVDGCTSGACSERRHIRCDCGKRPGQGHRLVCSMMLGGDRAA